MTAPMQHFDPDQWWFDALPVREPGQRALTSAMASRDRGGTSAFGTYRPRPTTPQAIEDLRTQLKSYGDLVAASPVRPQWLVVLDSFESGLRAFESALSGLAGLRAQKDDLRSELYLERVVEFSAPVRSAVKASIGALTKDGQLQALEDALQRQAIPQPAGDVGEQLGRQDVEAVLDLLEPGGHPMAGLEPLIERLLDEKPSVSGILLSPWGKARLSARVPSSRELDELLRLVVVQAGPALGNEALVQALLLVPGLWHRAGDLDMILMQFDADDARA